jgi:uncharacterized protein YdeI (YjbR/CyaY-like superfamily)
VDIGETLYVVSRNDFRAWLAGHHNTAKDIWLVFYRKSSGKPSVTYNDAIEEAICFGWIDGLQKSIDAERYALRFTPRRKQSAWSQSNVARALKMLREGKMTEAGMGVLPPEILQLWQEQG